MQISNPNCTQRRQRYWARAGAQCGVGGLVSLAGCSENHSERDIHNLLTGKLGRSLPLPLHTLPGAGSSEKKSGSSCELEMIQVRDRAGFLLDSNSWHVQSGLKKPDPERERLIWALWWERYKALDPADEVVH